MEQFEQLLTCAICLDRYRNPKLLPCQHSFCMEPCMDGLVDYVRRQVKCPECRAEHRIPYQGVQGYPTNVTLQRFLELHIEITGELPDPTSGQIMKRCNVCSEKAYCTMCLHCDKEICPECKGAHKDILRREISRITNQIRRALHRLEDILAYVEKSMLALQQNCTSVSEEVEELYGRLNKALKDRTEYLRNEIDRYLTTEHKNLSSLKENLQVEISNIQSNCDLADKYMQNEVVEWDDCELMDAKEIFLKTVEFIRYFETETGDYTRRAKFIMAHEPNQLVKHVAGYGDLSINNPHQFLTSGNAHPTSGNMLQPPGPGLMRSKSDHRLASQFRQQEERGGYDGNSENSGRVSPLGGRKFGERYPTRSATSDRLDNRYGRADRSEYGTDFDSGYDNEGGRSARSRFRSRLAARHANENADSDTDVQGPRSVRFSDTHIQHPCEKERDRVLDTEDVAKGPLSGITRLYDSPRVMKRLQETETKKIKKEKEPTPLQQQKFQPPPQRKPSNTAPVTQRQVSEDDEISRIKRQNKNAPAAPAEVPAETPPHRTTVPERVSSLRRDDSRDERQVSSPNRSSAASDRNRKTPAREAVSSEEDSNEDDKEQEEAVSSLQQTQRRSSKTPVTSGSRRSSASSDIVSQPGAVLKKSARSASSDSTASSESSTGSSSGVRNTGAAFTTDELRQQYLTRTGRESSAKGMADSNSGNSSPRTKVPPDTKKEVTPTTGASRFQSRFLSGANRTNSTSSPINEKPKAENVEEDNDDDEEETETSTESEETESEDEVGKKTETGAKSGLEKTDIGPLLARSANARDNGPGSPGANSSYRRSSRDDGSSSSRPSYASPKDAIANRSSSKYLSNNRNDEPEPKSRFTSRFLNKSKSTAMAPTTDEDDYLQGTGRRYSGNDDSAYFRREPAAYTSFKDRKARLARSKSTHGFGEDLEGDLDENSASSYYPASYLASKASNAGNDLSRSRSSHVLKSRENSPERPLSSNTGSEKDGSSLSSWARYLKNKYGNRSKDIKDNNLPSSAVSGPSSSTTSRRLSLGLPLRGNNSASVESSDDDQKNLEGSPNSPTAATAVQAGFAEVGTTLRSQYMQKRQLCFKIGSRGSGPGCFTWPRGIAVGPDNSIVIADSSNHRVQVFDQNGKFMKEFGSFGNGEGEFDCLAGIAVNRIGQYIIADRYNHRVQVLDPSGRFLRAFGSQGTADGRFNYPWGITTDALGFIYVCDKENHRIQVFQSDGTFVGKFGSYGNKIGQLEHPHYIAVSNTNRVIVSDSNNHRVQIFDVNGRVLNSIASEGSSNGQFKFPRGVAVDDQGYILVGDSGNNRIQIFHPDGTFLRSFGCWGSGDGEFKGLEGVAVMSNGNILVCDRENHRVQVF
ncbi:RING finger protein nhl-1 isoform X2 [Planococcus citri]|uniref:RING finger protein nhl-1 isoform X2 n=1 Tax=Planococcus citri TaxID=170843 RepID=UPI0031F9F9AD